MRRKTILVLSCLLIASILPVMTVSGKGNLEFKANGKIDHYPNSQDDPASVIVGGRWDMKVQDGKACFKGYYRELNIDEDVELSPEGSIDHFKLWLMSDDYWFEGDDLVIHGVMYVDKKMWFLDEYEPGDLPDWFDPDWIPDHAPVNWIPDFMVRNAEIRISPDVMTYDYELDGVNAYGTTLTYHNYS